MKDTRSSNSESSEDVSALKKRIRELEQSIKKSKKAEEALRASEAKFRFLSENMADVAFTVDMNLRTTYVSPSIEKILGFTPEERKIQPVEEQISPPCLKRVFETLTNELESEKTEAVDPDRSRIMTLDFYHKDGSIKSLETNIRSIRDGQGEVTGFYGLSRDITENRKAEEEQKKTLESLRKALGAILQVMVSVVETRDRYTAGHQLRVADLSRSIATEMGLSKEKIEGIRIAGSVHDIGKLSIPTEILSKPAKLSDIEFSMIKEHPKYGYELLKDVEYFRLLAEIVYQHHERMDGSGYPRHLTRGDILIEARILAVADVVEAMVSHRPYRPGLGIDTALDEIKKNSNILYDTDAVRACLKIFQETPYRFKEHTYIH